MFFIVFTLLFVDLFDTIGTIIGVSSRAGIIKNGKIPNLKQAFFVDAIGTTCGAIMGSSTVTTFVESAAGVEEGGRSGLTAFVSGICFALAIFFAPFFLAIPASATAPALVLVGLMMMGSVVKIKFNDYSEAIPAFFRMVPLFPLCARYKINPFYTSLRKVCCQLDTEEARENAVAALNAAPLGPSRNRTKSLSMPLP